MKYKMTVYYQTDDTINEDGLLVDVEDAIADHAEFTGAMIQVVDPVQRAEQDAEARALARALKNTAGFKHD